MQLKDTFHKYICIHLLISFKVLLSLTILNHAKFKSFCYQNILFLFVSFNTSLFKIVLNFNKLLQKVNFKIMTVFC